MNAVDYLRENKRRRKENTSDKLINNQFEEITVDDVIFSNYNHCCVNARSNWTLHVA